MSNELVAALIGAIAGAMAGGAVSWLLQRRQIAAQRNWDLALRVSEILGTVLSAYTPDALKSKEDVWQLQQLWGQQARGMSLLGWEGHRSNSPLTQAMNDYFQALLASVEGNMKRGELEHRRAHCREIAEQIIQRNTR